jgi:hypothetical protein
MQPSCGPVWRPGGTRCPGEESREGGFVNLLEAFPLWHTRGMNTPAAFNRYKNHRFPAEIICLSYRNVEEWLVERGITVTYEAIRQ